MKDNAERIAELAKQIEPIQGWLNPQAGGTLYNLGVQHIPTAVIVELGSWKGRSTAWLGFSLLDRGGGTLYAVDHWMGSTGEIAHQQLLQNYGEDQLYQEFVQNMEKLGLQNIVNPIRMDTIRATRQIPLETEIGLLHIDASHRYEDVRRDFEFWSPYVKTGGYIVFDDVPSWPGPTRLVTELPRWYRQVAISPNQWIVKKVEY
ncbi:class I SAM-dependent methyltransferase [Brevibacillus fulvus]|uniref:O-methyltransferase YrrM n=1 Tax=Brevibacillus fulvus TaxID=1125967 RepID=A0A939BQY4_9BACL|nr:class I SAM-dependent methyltransferase [Brevibacillus fulvus]MBM7589022.1 putative O-methyltransferase YrrM [Brevibacillus fulvus]